MKLPHRLLPLLLIAALATSLAGGAALAQDSSQDPSSAQYDPPVPTAEAEESDEGSGLESEIGFLPFTGLDLLIVAGVALVLTGTGFALRRLTEPRGPLA